MEELVGGNILQWAIGVYTEAVTPAIAIAFAFGMGNLIVGTFLRVAFGGRLKFSAGGK